MSEGDFRRGVSGFRPVDSARILALQDSLPGGPGS